MRRRSAHPTIHRPLIYTQENTLPSTRIHTREHLISIQDTYQQPPGILHYRFIPTHPFQRIMLQRSTVTVMPLYSVPAIILRSLIIITTPRYSQRGTIHHPATVTHPPAHIQRRDTSIQESIPCLELQVRTIYIPVFIQYPRTGIHQRVRILPKGTFIIMPRCFPHPIMQLRHMVIPLQARIQRLGILTDYQRLVPPGSCSQSLRQVRRY